jgi:hypothetical protein
MSDAGGKSGGSAEGRPRRRSVLVDRQQLPSIAARERVAALLRAHHVAPDDTALSAIAEEDFALVRIIAQEGSASNIDPAIRYTAIAALARTCHRENLNLVAELAAFGEDFYVRGHAVLALGTTGLVMTLPIVAAHLDAQERFEQLAAERAVEALVRRNSPAAVRSFLAVVDNRQARTRIETIIDRVAEDARAAPSEPRTTEPRRQEPAQRPARPTNMILWVAVALVVFILIALVLMAAGLGRR